MEFWTKAMLAVVAVAVVVVLVGSVYTVGEEPDPAVECKLGSVYQADSSSNADDSLLAKGEVWAYAKVYVYTEEDLDFDEIELPALTLDGVTYEALYVKVDDRSDSATATCHYKLVLYYAVSGIYDDDGKPVKDVTDYAELALPDGWALRS